MNKDEALQVIRSNYPTGRKQLCEALETLIPELKKSDDEKIRKTLKSFFDSEISDYGNVEWRNGIRYGEIVSWLEKQGEQKHLFYPIKDYQGSFPCWNNALDIRPKHLQRCICYDKYMEGVYCYVYDDISKYWCNQMTEEHDSNGDNHVCDYADYRVTMWMPIPDTTFNVHDKVEPKFIGCDEDYELVEQKSTCPLDNSYSKVKFPFKAKVKSNGKIVTIHGGQLSMNCKKWIKYQSDVEDGYMVYNPEDLELVCNIEQKPTEWSDRDWYYYSKLESFLEVKDHYSPTESSSGYQKDVHETLIWLKSLRPNKYVTWSEEDEHCIELLLSIIDSSSLIPKNRKKCKIFLKSLKERVQSQSN